MYRSDSLPTSMETHVGRSSERTPAPRTASCFGQTAFLPYETATDHSVPSRQIWLKMIGKRDFKHNIANRDSGVHISVPCFSLPVAGTPVRPGKYQFINIVVLMQRHFSRKQGQERASGTKDSPRRKCKFIRFDIFGTREALFSEIANFFLFPRHFSCIRSPNKL